MKLNSGQQRFHFHGALSGLVREEEFAGRNHLVAPVVMVREMVLDQGDHGEFLPAEEIERSVDMALWEGRPITIGHPQENGRFQSAGELEAAEKLEVGRLRNVQAKSNGTTKLAGEAWLDIEQAERLEQGREVLATLRKFEEASVPDSARPLEVSTGYWAELEREGGTFNGSRYAGIQRAMIPDHLALLPNGVGKCSREDGCGMPRLNAGGSPVLNTEVALPHALLVPNAEEWDGSDRLRTNVLSTARTPDFDDTTPGEVPGGWPPDLSDFIEANGWDAEQWDDLTQDQQDQVVATTLLGEVSETFRGSMVFPVVDVDGNLRENALVAVLGGRGAQADVPEDALASARGMARTLLEDEFGRDLEEEENVKGDGDGDGDGFLNRLFSRVTGEESVVVNVFGDGPAILGNDSTGSDSSVEDDPVDDPAGDGGNEDDPPPEAEQNETEFEIENGQLVVANSSECEECGGGEEEQPSNLEGIEMNRENVIERLAESEDTHWDRETLEGLSDQQLADVANASELDFSEQEEDGGGEADEGDGDADSGDAEAQANADEGDEDTVALDQLPPEVRDLVENERQSREQEASEIRGRLKQNEACGLSDEVLESMDLPALKELESDYSRSYRGRGGSRSRANAGDDEEGGYEGPRAVVLSDIEEDKGDGGPGEKRAELRGT